MCAQACVCACGCARQADDKGAAAASQIIIHFKRQKIRQNLLPTTKAIVHKYERDG